MTNLNSILTGIILVILCFTCTKKASELATPSAPVNTRTVDNSQQATQIFLVRHAEKSKDDPRDPNLTQKGHERAERLKYHLADANITKIYSTDYNRTRQTVQPLAEALGLEIIIYNPDLIEISRLIEESEEGNILVAGHSNSTPKLVNKLLGVQKHEKLDESVYNTLYLVAKSGNQFTSTVLRY